MTRDGQKTCAKRCGLQGHARVGISSSMFGDCSDSKLLIVGQTRARASIRQLSNPEYGLSFG